MHGDGRGGALTAARRFRSLSESTPELQSTASLSLRVSVESLAFHIRDFSFITSINTFGVESSGSSA